MGGCLSCRNKHTLINSPDGPPQGTISQSYQETVPSVSHDFWTTSTRDMDNSVQSQGSMSSLSTSVQAVVDSQGGGGVGSSSGSSEFVNHGLLLWQQTRQRWVDKKKSSNRKRPQQQQPKKESTLSRNTSYESLLGSNKPFVKPVPLSEMIDFLVYVWDEEGIF